MKRLLILGLMMTSVGCSGMNNTQAGAVEGGVIGGVLGTLVGAACRNPVAGLAIGAAGGALVGGAAGSNQDRRENEVKQAVAQQQAQAQAQMMRIEDVVMMTHQHVQDEMIINQINATYSNFNLTADQVVYLKQQGVSDRVISVMQFHRAVPVGYVYRGPRYVYAEPPPVSGGVVFVGGRGRW